MTIINFTIYRILLRFVSRGDSRQIEILKEKKLVRSYEKKGIWQWAWKLDELSRLEKIDFSLLPQKSFSPNIISTFVYTPVN